MKRKTLCLLLALLLVFTVLASCNNTTNSNSPSNSTSPGGTTNPEVSTSPVESTNSANPSDTGNAEAADPYPTLANGNITVLWHTDEEAFLTSKANLEAEGKKAFDAVWSVKEAFEKKYGGTVTVVAVPWGDMKPTLISMVANGEACELAQANDQNFPIYPAKKLVKPVTGIVDLNDTVWNPAVSESFTFNGQVYAMGTDATSIQLYYNKDLFESYGIKTPDEYYAEGKWNWNTFREVAMALTDDTDGDGVNDQFGFGWWDAQYNLFLGSNGLTNILYKDDGTITTNYDKPAAIEALQFLQDAYNKDGYIDKTRSGDYFIGDFRAGKLAMTCEYGMLIYGDVTFELGCLPFPRGPKVDVDSGYGGLSGWVIPVTSTNDEGAAAFAYMSSQMRNEIVYAEMFARWDEAAVARYNGAVSNIKFAPIGIDKYWDNNWTVHVGLLDNTPIATFTAAATDMIREGAISTLEQ